MFNDNPVLTKELKQRFRHRKGAVILFLYLLVIGSFILGTVYVNWRYQGLRFDPRTGRELFIILSVFQLILLGFVTPGLTAGTISGERERQTLNVLLTTELTPASIIVGKMFSSCAFTLLLIICTLPLYSLVYMLGGVAPAQLGGVFAIYLVTMFLFAAVGVACSTFFKRTSVSTVSAYGIVAFLGAGTAALAGFIQVFLRKPGEMMNYLPAPVQLLLDINPVMVLIRVMGEDMEMGAPFLLPYWGTYTLFYLGVGVLLILWSSRKLNPLRKSSGIKKFR